MNEWLEQFYSDPAYRAALLGVYGPLFARYAGAIRSADGGQVNPEFVAALTATYVDGHLDSSRAQLQTLLDDPEPERAISQRLDEWAEKRPAKVAAEQAVRAGNAIALDEFRQAGVRRKVWRSTGGACAYCGTLDGTTVELEQPFFGAGDSFQPEGVERPLTFSVSVGHPPAHPGCDCSVEAG
ncbi:MAG: phage head morphogenesis protein [Chloroflexi bacterium]|nr:phage head morphogenesis protein [Chloroflexota bacterium]